MSPDSTSEAVFHDEFSARRDTAFIFAQKNLRKKRPLLARQKLGSLLLDNTIYCGNQDRQTQLLESE